VVYRYVGIKEESWLAFHERLGLASEVETNTQLEIPKESSFNRKISSFNRKKRSLVPNLGVGVSQLKIFPLSVK